MPAIHGVRRPLEIHTRVWLSADALRPARRSHGIDRSRRRPLVCRRHWPPAIELVRLGAASQRAYYNKHREDCGIRKPAAAIESRNSDWYLGRSGAVGNPKEDRIEITQYVIL